MITITITEDGDQLFLVGHGAEVFCEAGVSTVWRASYVVPESLPLRLLFRAIRAIVPDKSKIAQWTRSWQCLWRVHVIAEGVDITLNSRYHDRSQAIKAEIHFLNQFFMEKNNG
jgi:hypothetical protein